MWRSQALDSFRVGTFSTLLWRTALRPELRNALRKPLDEDCRQLHFHCWAQVRFALTCDVTGNVQLCSG